MTEKPKLAAPRQWLDVKSLEFSDAHQEADFRRYWEAYARSNVLLISVIICISGLAATVNAHRKCTWSEACCTAAMGIVAYNAAVHALLQYLARKRGSTLVLDERRKGYGLVNNLMVSMLLIMLVEDFDEIPITHPASCYAFHGWMIVFLQVNPINV